MSLRWKCATLFGYPEQCVLLLTKKKKKRAIDSCSSPVENLAAMKEMIRDHCLLPWQHDESARTKEPPDARGCLSKCRGHGWELGFSILSSEPLCLVLKVSSCLRCPLSVLPGPPSHSPWPRPLLRTAARFNLPNAVMGQANQSPGWPWGPANHFKTRYTWS